MSAIVKRLALIFVAAGLVAAGQNAFAQTVPYVALGFDAEYNPATGDYSGPGIGVSVGVHVFDGNVVPDGVFFPAPGIFFAGTFAGSQVVTTEGGDTIDSNVSGAVVLEIDPDTGLITGTWNIDFEVTGGTGRFANASGQLRGIAINPPFDIATAAVWNFDWFVAGKIELAKRR
jgi:hypothetical protein